MTRKRNEALCIAHGRLPKFGEQRKTIQVGGPGWLATNGPLGPVPVSAPAVDLLDIATTVFSLERELPPRAASNPNLRYVLTVPVREPDLWKGKPGQLLQELLGFLGNNQWEVTFVQGAKAKAKYAPPTDEARSIRQVALLSGGLDSSAGLGSGFLLANETQLCSYYTRQKELQGKIAAELGFSVPTQWRHQGTAGRGRSFYYRSFLFLTLAAVTAYTWKACQIVQFENGILASAIPPVPSVAMTRHAHPRLHKLFTELLKSILPAEWSVSNPLWTYTKRQAVESLTREAGAKKAAAITPMTQSCWNLAAPHAFGIKKLGTYAKKVNRQCGVCIPCIIRRTALPKEQFSFDLRSDIVRNEAKLGAFFLEYVELLSAVRTSKNTAEFRRALPSEALDLIDDGWASLSSLEELWRRFTKEFYATFF